MIVAVRGDKNWFGKQRSAEYIHETFCCVNHGPDMFQKSPQSSFELTFLAEVRQQVCRTLVQFYVIDCLAEMLPELMSTTAPASDSTQVKQKKIPTEMHSIILVFVCLC